MPIDYERLHLTTDIHLLPANTTVGDAYLALFQTPADAGSAYSSIVVPSEFGTLLVRWDEIEAAAVLSGYDITSLRICDLPRLEVRPGHVPDLTQLPAKLRTRTLRDILSCMQPVALLDEQVTTTQEARTARDDHPGRRALVVARGRVKGALVVTTLGGDSPAQVIRHLLRSAGAVLGQPKGLLSIPLAAPPTTTRWQPRKVEAAMPQTGMVGRVTEVWVKISLPESAGLGSELPDRTHAGDLVGRETVVAEQADVALAPQGEAAVIYAILDAPGFEVPAEPQPIQLRPDRDSPTLRLLLTPLNPAPHALVRLALYQDPATRAAIASVVLTTTIAQDPAQPGEALVWVLRRQQLVAVAAAAGGAQSLSFVGGDFYTIGDISNATIAVGRGAQARATMLPPQP